MLRKLITFQNRSTNTYTRDSELVVHIKYHCSIDS